MPTVVVAPAPTRLALPTVAELHEFVHRELCRFDALDPDQAPLRKSPIAKLGRRCGWIFHVDGPRNLRTSAIWATEESRILLYDSTGMRVREVKLNQSPEV